jgi:hypothetical protein
VTIRKDFLRYEKFCGVCAQMIPPLQENGRLTYINYHDTHFFAISALPG